MYESIPKYDRATAILSLESGSNDKIVHALLSLVLYDSEDTWVQDLCVQYSQNLNDNIRGVAILCFSHLARIHRRLKTEIVVPIIIQALHDSSTFVRGNADTALSDIMIFCSTNNYDRRTSLSRLESKQIDDILLGLYEIAKNDDDLNFAEAICIKYSDHSNPIIKGEALKGFATIVYEHRKIDLQKVMPILKEAVSQGGYAGECARSTIDCIETYRSNSEESESVD